MNLPPPRFRLQTLVGLFLLVALFTGCWYVFGALRQASKLQECFASGRTSCVMIDERGAHVTR